jgi:hypothetical protein
VDAVLLFLLVFLAGWATGTLGVYWTLGLICRKAAQDIQVKHNTNENDPADWWKEGGNPPGVYEED